MNYQNELNRKIYSAGEQGIENFQRVGRIVMFQGPIRFFPRPRNRPWSQRWTTLQAVFAISEFASLFSSSFRPTAFVLDRSFTQRSSRLKRRGNSRSSACSRTEHYYQMALAQCFHPFTVRSYAKTSGRMLHIAGRFFPPVAADIGKLSISLCETIQRTRS